VAASLGSLIFFSSRMDEALAFYRALGVPLEREQHEDESPVHYAAELNGVHVALYEASPGSATRFREGGCTWPGFSVEDLDATLARLPARVLTAPEERPWGMRAVVEDPDGRPIEIWSATSVPKPEAAQQGPTPAQNPTGVRVRPAEFRDAGEWASLRASLWPDADASELAAETRAFFAGNGPPSLDAGFVAEARDAQHDSMIGFIEVSIRPFSDGCDSMPVPHVEGWYVEPAARGRGVGRCLIENAEAWSRARGFGELASDTEIENHASLLAHEACGFEQTERLVKFRKRLD
jgi:aminoglycoside 6'-N-acetyltransferase I